MGDLVLCDEARRAISRWTRDDYYVYFRPVTSTYFQPKEAHRIHWNVRVEYRCLEYMTWDGSGSDLEAVILKLAEKVPKRQEFEPGYISAGKNGRPSHLGPLAPGGPLYSNAMIERDAQVRARKASEKKESSKPKKKSKKGKKKS